MNRLEKTIADLTSEVDSCQENGSSSSGRTLAALKKERWGEMCKLTQIVEERRVAHVVAEAEAADPGISEWSDDKSECPICLDCISSLGPNSAFRLMCCGACICISCAIAAKVKVMLELCPLCRQKIPLLNAHDTFAATLEHAESGKIWAQQQVATHFRDKNDLKRNVYWLRRAAEQGDSSSQYNLGTRLKYGLGTQQSDAEALYFLELAAKQGQADAQHLLGRILRGEKKLYWFTLSASQGNEEAQMDLAGLHALGLGGLPESEDTGFYYCEKAALNGCAAAQEELSNLLLKSAYNLYDGEFDLVGYNAIPRSLYWARKAVSAKAGKRASDHVSALEAYIMQQCGNCGKRAEANTHVKKCLRCNAIGYCGRTCQVEHWQKGHKRDCVDCKKLDAKVKTLPNN